MKTSTQVMRFLLVGTLGAATNFVVYWALSNAAMPYVLASWVGWLCGLGLVFVLNKAFTFKATGSVASQFLRTLAIYLLQQVTFSFLLVFFVELVRLDKNLSYFAALPFAVAISFFGMREFAFRGSAGERDQNLK